MEPADLKNSPLYNSRIIDSYIRLVKQRYAYVNVAELLDCARMKEYEVADQAHWFTQEQIDRFYEKLVQMTGNRSIAREAGQYAASPDALGAMRQYVLGLVGASNAFELLGKTTANFTRSSRYESRKLSVNKVEVVVTPLEDGLEKPFQCENRIGFFEAIVTIFNRNGHGEHRFPEVQHPECMFRGGSVCRYVITWEKSLAFILKKLLLGSVVLLALLNGAAFYAANWPFASICLSLSLVILLALAIATYRCENGELLESLHNTRDSNEKLIEQININYNNAQMTNEIGQALGMCTKTADILTSVVGIMAKRLNYDRGIILLANQERTKLEIQAGYGHTADTAEFFNSMSFRLDDPESKGVFTNSFRDQRPYLVNDIKEIEKQLSLHSLKIARKLGSQSFVCCPIVCQGASIGVLAVDNVKSGKTLVQSDISLLMGIASVIAISIRNSELIEARLRQFYSVLQVLAASIDARDSLTAGHSEKVTEYALAICGELNLPAEFAEVIRVAALLHDYGKIGVPDTILKKPGRLTREEYEIVKTHVNKTSDILAQINFEGIYRDVPEIVRAHHEKIDGSGYPRGISGDAIPLGSRIIAVADYFEAITSKRHYRDPMPVYEAFALLREESGKHLEKEIVDALISWYCKTMPGAPQVFRFSGGVEPEAAAGGGH